MAGRKERIISALSARRRQVRKIARERREEMARARKELEHAESGASAVEGSEVPSPQADPR